ncbi:MAG TPA: neutral/alkaline non-lysosomal ceramidase N-terminal domain-containing protein, partial [Planctomycetota bacterium]|nr:neutral/alkaline non-lysosomal ceramidase N-terminal domain-containing protein [Planctomycetota bacterium]
MNATRKCSISVFLVLILTAGLLPQTTAEEFEWTQAGAAKIDITPEEPVRLTGYGERKVEFEGIEQRIWARAIAFGSDTNTCILIAVENCGITADIVSEVASRVKKQIGVPRERLVICSTHTHTAPAVLRFAPTILTDLTPEQSARIEKYTAWVTERITAAALAAAAARKPARLSWSEGSAAFAANRRVLKNGLWTGFGINPDGPVQHKLPVLRATDKQGKLIAAVANYACHCTTLGGGFNKVCGDWAGYASEFVEAEVTGSTALITIGCGADTNPNPRGKLEMAKEHGRVLANEVQRQLQEPGRPLPVKIDARFSETRLPLSAAPSKEQFRTIADDTKQRDASRRHAREWLARFEKGEKAPDHVVLPLANWSFGTALNMLFIGGEVVIDYDTLVRERFDSSRMWISAYANDVPCYIPSQRILKEGGYEAQFSMIYYGKPAPFAPEVESTLLDAIKDVVPKEFARPAPKEEAAPKGADAGPGTRPALTPEQGLKSLRVKAGFRVELAAAEPLVESPVAFDWGPDGRLWVVEMRDYPIGMDGKGSPGGRIKVLTDTDGDGRYDKAAIFLDALPCPTAVKVWRDGAIVAAAPEIFFAKDTDGDGKADKRETLYSGFTQGNQQHLVNSLFFRLDGGLQVANGDSGGMIKSARTGQVVDIRGRDLSIYPDSGTHVAQSGPTQFGTCRDDWDNWFGGNNSYPMWHYALEDVYLRRNPHAASPNPRIQVSVDPGPSRVYPSSETTTRFNDHDKANRFTSACSPVIYRDSFLSGLSGNAFICEPVHNLVHREIVSAKGITFSSRRAADEEQSEFLSSTDNWFRPVWIRTGPDGALWIADMYRYVIEHPQWIPRGWQRQLNIRAGEDRGRIYRVVPAAGGKPVPRLDNLDTAALVQRLNDSNGTVRDLAHQVLVWKNDPAAVVPLRELARSAATPQARLHAIYVLNAIGALDKASLIPALSDAHAGVRRHAIRLSERALKDGDTEVLRTAIALEKDPDPQVQMQLACSLGMSAHADAGKALLRLAVLHASDEYLFAAVASSMLPHLQTMVEDLSAQPALLKGQPALAVQLLKMAVAEDRAESLAQLLKAATAEQDNAPWRFTLLSAFLDTLQSRGTSWSAYLQRSEVLQKCKSSFAVALESARKVVADNAAPLEGRLGAVRLLGRDAAGAEMDLKILAEQLSPLTPPELQREAVAALGRIRDPRASEAMLSGWKNHGPALRQTVLDTLLSRQDSTLILLERMKKMPALVTAMDASRRQRLLKHKEEAIRTRAAEVLVEDLDSDRAKVVAKHDAVLRMYGDAQRGKAVFATVCAACHQLEGAGN